MFLNKCNSVWLVTTGLPSLVINHIRNKTELGLFLLWWIKRRQSWRIVNVRSSDLARRLFWRIDFDTDAAEKHPEIVDEYLCSAKNEQLRSEWIKSSFVASGGFDLEAAKTRRLNEQMDKVAARTAERLKELA